MIFIDFAYYPVGSAFMHILENTEGKKFFNSLESPKAPNPICFYSNIACESGVYTDVALDISLKSVFPQAKHLYYRATTIFVVEDFFVEVWYNPYVDLEAIIKERTINPNYEKIPE